MSGAVGELQVEKMEAQTNKQHLKFLVTILVVSPPSVTVVSRLAHRHHSCLCLIQRMTARGTKIVSWAAGIFFSCFILLVVFFRYNYDAPLPGTMNDNTRNGSTTTTIRRRHRGATRARGDEDDRGRGLEMHLERYLL
jgi:hypothetical protein